jgi:DNA-binding FrmR family transcriptional regulator
MEDARKAELRARLKRIAGQVVGIQRMLDDERSYVEVLTQLSAVRAALGKVSHLLRHEHLARSVARILGRNTRERDQEINELLRILDQVDR